MKDKCLTIGNKLPQVETSEKESRAVRGVYNRLQTERGAHPERRPNSPGIPRNCAAQPQLSRRTHFEQNLHSRDLLRKARAMERRGPTSANLAPLHQAKTTSMMSGRNLLTYSSTSISILHSSATFPTRPAMSRNVLRGPDRSSFNLIRNRRFMSQEPLFSFNGQTIARRLVCSNIPSLIPPAPTCRTQCPAAPSRAATVAGHLSYPQRNQSFTNHISELLKCSASADKTNNIEY